MIHQLQQQPESSTFEAKDGKQLLIEWFGEDYKSIVDAVTLDLVQQRLHDSDGEYDDESANDDVLEDGETPVFTPIKLIPQGQPSEFKEDIKSEIVPKKTLNTGPPRRPKTVGNRSVPLSRNVVIEDSDDEDAAGTDLDLPLSRRKKTTTSSSSNAGKRQKPVLISDELRQLTGPGEFTRYEITSVLWKYIKLHQLQDPSDKRFILCDEAMQRIMDGKKRVNQMHLARHLTKHIYTSTEKVVAQDESEQAEDHVEVKKQVKRQQIKTEDGEHAVKKARTGGLMRPMLLSQALSDLLGGQQTSLPRTQVVKQLWEYIKLHQLQDPLDKRYIVCDELMQKVMGGKRRLTAFQMQKYITPHLFNPEDIVTQQE